MIGDETIEFKIFFLYGAEVLGCVDSLTIELVPPPAECSLKRSTEWPTRLSVSILLGAKPNRFLNAREKCC